MAGGARYGEQTPYADYRWEEDDLLVLYVDMRSPIDPAELSVKYSEPRQTAILRYDGAEYRYQLDVEDSTTFEQCGAEANNGVVSLFFAAES